MRNRSRIFSTLLVCLLLITPALVFAQTTGTIEGTITDQSGSALPGVTVDLAGAGLQGARSAVTSADGRYRFLSVSPGAYTVTATLSGFGRVQKKATVTLDSTITANLQMNLSTTAEVTVTGEAPLIDTSSTTGGSNYTAKVISQLPVSRNYTDIVKSNPGVNEDRGETQGRANALTIYGATSVENQYIIDGVNTTNVIKGFQGKALNGEFIQEVEVKTGGYQAEYGRALGGVVNVITKSGGNEFHGDAFAYYDSFGLRAKQDLCPLGGTAPDDTTCNGTGPDTLIGMRIADYEKLDGGFDLGGYVWKDRIWFFMAYDRVIYPTQTVGRFADSAAVSNNEQFPLNQWDNLYSGKLTFNIAQGTTLTGSYFSDPSVIDGAAGSDPRQSRVATITSQSRPHLGIPPRHRRPGLGRPDQPAHRLGRPRAVAGRAAQGPLPVEALGRRIGHPLQRLHLRGRHARTRRAPCPTVQNSTTGGFGQIFGPTVNNYSKRMMYKGDFTFYLGNNEVKAGVDYQKGTTNAISFYTGIGEGGYIGGQTVGIYNEYGQQYYQHNFYAPCADRNNPECSQPINNVIAPSSADLGWYIQDSFKVTPSFTINAGLRWDKEDVNDYTGATAFSTTNEWQPRIGVIWDPNANGQMKIYAFYGRFYYSLPTDLNVRAYGAQTNGVTYNFDPVDTTQSPDVIGHETAFFQGGAFTEPVQPGLKGIYQDEVSAGFDMLLDPSFSVGVKGMYRNLGNTIEDRCDLDGTSPLTNFNTCAIINPGSDSPLATGVGIPGCNGLDGNSDGCFDIDPADRQGQADVLGRRARRPQAVHQRPLGPGLPRVLEPEGQLRRRGPRGPRPDRPRHQRRLRLLPVPAQQRGQALPRRAVALPPRRVVHDPLQAVCGLELLPAVGRSAQQAGLLQLGLRRRDPARRARHRADAPGALRDEPDARLSDRPGPGDDHPADLHVQPPEQAAGDPEGRPVLDLAAGRIHRLLGRHVPGALLALRPEPAADQRELRHVHAAPGAAPVPVRAEGLLLGRARVSQFEGAAAAAPFLCSVAGGMILSSRRFPCVDAPPPPPFSSSSPSPRPPPPCPSSS